MHVFYSLERVHLCLFHMRNGPDGGHEMMRFLNKVAVYYFTIYFKLFHVDRIYYAEDNCFKILGDALNLKFEMIFNRFVDDCRRIVEFGVIFVKTL